VAFSPRSFEINVEGPSPVASEPREVVDYEIDIDEDNSSGIIIINNVILFTIIIIMTIYIF
jgi:hypothetical protein